MILSHLENNLKCLFNIIYYVPDLREEKNVDCASSFYIIVGSTINILLIKQLYESYTSSKIL